VFNKSLKVDNGITIAGGQDDYAGKIFRVSHLGYYDDLDMITVAAAIERALMHSGFRMDAGAGVAAVHRALLRI
jgi:serine---pyruvate transaminase